MRDDRRDPGQHHQRVEQQRRQVGGTPSCVRIAAVEVVRKTRCSATHTRLEAELLRSLYDRHELLVPQHENHAADRR